MSSRAVRLSSLLLAGALALSACGGDGNGGGDDAEKKGSSSSSGSASPSETETNADGTTTAGTSLEFGESATVTWQPKEKVKGTIDLAVQKVLLGSRADFSGFTLDDAMKTVTPYYVTVKVENAGESDLSGVELPIFLDNGSDVLFPAAQFNSAFSKCPNRNLPAKFVAGRKTSLCMVFLANEGTKLESIAVRPDEDEATIDWSGKVTDPKAAAKKKAAKKKAGKGKKKAS